MHPARRQGACPRAAALLGIALLGLAAQALGASTQEACAALLTARAKLLEMVDSRGKGDLDALKREIYASSAELEGAVGALTGADAARAVAFRRVWEAFKRTREQEILPAVYRGRHDQARSIAYGVQAERFEKMKAALGCQ
jgi:hypothetical protein